MDWTDQAEEVIKSWTSAQRNMWEGWLNAMQSLGTAPQSTEVWEQTVDQWRSTVKNALETQITWTRFWAESVQKNTGTVSQLGEWSQQVLDMMERWTETQVQLSDRWFDAVKQSRPTTVAQVWDNQEAQKVVYDWQEATRRTLEAQIGWIRFWVATQVRHSGEHFMPEAPPISEVHAGTPESEAAPLPAPAEEQPMPTSEVDAGAPGSQAGAAPAQGATTRLVNINTAGVAELTSLPKIGPALAKRIVDYREAHGPFATVQDLTKVQGIGANNMGDYIHLLTT